MTEHLFISSSYVLHSSDLKCYGRATSNSKTQCKGKGIMKKEK
jgi:hypothetical protein